MANLLTNDFFYSAKLGFEFEFYSNLNRNEISRELGKILGKKLLLFNKYHSNFKPTKDIFKLEPDYSGGSKMVELVTGPLPYFEAIIILIKTLKWIDENGYTDKKCAFQFGVSIDTSIYPEVPPIDQINTLKYILGFDENFVYKRFPERMGSLYAKSIKRILPINKFVDPTNISFIDKNLFEVPLEKNMGINFLKLPEGYFEVRYLGGKDYQKKYTTLKEVIDYIITYTVDVLKYNNGFTENDLKVLRMFLNEIYKNSSTFIDPDTFRKNYPHMNIMVDLRSDPQILRSFFINIREVLYDLIVENNIKEGIINYDSSLGKFQLKDIKTTRAYLLKDYDILEGEISGNILNCRIFNCKLNDSTIEECDLITNNEINRSKIMISDLYFTNSVHDSYIDNKDKEINCEVFGGIIRSGFIGKLATISPETEVVKDAEDDKKLKGSLKKRQFPNRNEGDQPSHPARFSDNNSKPSGIPGINFKSNN
ncbi:MAG: hypothetical protein EBS19_01350 [Spirochaetia bacterium]|nr:hypothetical protein [Spirochaetia bacterium]